MAEGTDVATTEEDNEEQPSRKKRGLFVVIIILLLGAIAAGLFFSGLLDDVIGKSDGKKQEQSGDDGAGGDEEKQASGEAGGKADGKKKAGQVVYYELPEIVADLNPGSPTPSFIKVKVSLEAPNQKVADKIDQMQPKIMDIINTYVRELRPSDLKGSAGVYRLREELLLRINKALYPARINNILFKELLIQ